MDEFRQAYLEGFEGGDLAPARARMVEAYVNGVNGALVDNLTLAKIGGLNPKDSDAARTTLWKIFTSSQPKHAAEYASEREYVRFLRTQNRLKSTWDAAEISRRLQMNVMIAQGEVAFDKLLVANHKGLIVTKAVRVTEINVPAATQALHLLGKQQGMFVDRLEVKDGFDSMTDAELEAEAARLRDGENQA